MEIKLVPDSFNVPEKLETAHFSARKLSAKDVYDDYLAIMSNMDLIKKTRGGTDWPTPNFSFEDDFIDLCWHQREFENKSSFAYLVTNPEGTEYVGCFYFYKPGFRTEVPIGTDVDISFWVTQKAYDAGLYKELYITLKKWLNEKWLFKKPYWSNLEIPSV